MLKQLARFYFGFVLTMLFFNSLNCVKRSFKIDYERNTFVKDGVDFRYVSGSFHYFRSVDAYWGDIMKKFQLAGLNAVQTYVEWASHQPTPDDIYDFNGTLNIFKFLDTAQEMDMLVILRPGPFIDAERDMVGKVLTWKGTDEKNKAVGIDYLFYVTRWFDHLLPLLKPYLYSNGGPIIMIQVENEYGYNCQDYNHNYTKFLRDLIRYHLGNDIVLFTTDGAKYSAVMCGRIPDVYPTVDFGPLNDDDVNGSFEVQRHFAPYGPLINSEFYLGWFDFWGNPHGESNIAPILQTLNTMLSLGANVNMYMFYGGTSFGFGNGGYINDGKFDPCITSYDYDAPISESRDPTLKYFAIKNVIAKYKKVPDENPIFSKKLNLGEIQLKLMGHVMHPVFHKLLLAPVESKIPLSFEDLKWSSNFILYTTNIGSRFRDPSLLSIPGLRDRAYVYINDEYLGVLSRTEKILSLPISAQQGQTLSILVENQGRVVGSEMVERKGLGETVMLGNTRLFGWTMFKLELDGRIINKMAESSKSLPKNPFKNSGGIWFFSGNFSVPQNISTSTTGFLLDTFVRLDGWTKGIVWVNGFNLGRYWPVMGPQETLYLPGPLLYASPKQNTIVVMELEKSPPDCFVSSSRLAKCSIYLTDTHVINGPTPIS